MGRRLVVCSACKQEKPLYAREMCNNCYQRWRRRSNPEAVRAADRRRRANRSPEQVARQKITNRNWRIANSDKVRADHQEWYADLPWYKRNRMAGTTRGKLGVSVEFLKQLQESTPVCAVPGCNAVLDYERSAKQKPNQATLDKVIPEFGYTESNVQIICRSCNSKKVHGTMKDWMRFTQYVLRHESRRIGNPI